MSISITSLACYSINKEANVVRYAHLILLFFALVTQVHAKKLNLTEINKADFSQSPNNGPLSIENVHEILAILATNSDLPTIKRVYESGQQIECLKIKPLGKNLKGVHTGQLFAISIRESCFRAEGDSDNFLPLYILKESKKGVREIERLIAIHDSPFKASYVTTEQRLTDYCDEVGHETARVTFEEVNFKLVGHHQGPKYFSLLQTAPGKSLQEHLKAFGDSILGLDEESDEYQAQVKRMKYIFYRIGFSNNKLYQTYAVLGKGITHGDMHGQNIFYDDRTGDVSWIDIETVEPSLRKRSSGINDIADLYLLHSTRMVAHHVAKGLLTNVDFNINDDLWHELWEELFIGYLSAYDNLSEPERVLAFFQLKNKFIDALSNWQLFDNIRNFKDQRMLKRIGPSVRRIWLKESRIHKTFKNVRQRWLHPESGK